MHGQMFILQTQDSLTYEGADSQKNKFIPEDSICISCIATVGLVSFTSQKSQTNQQINSIVPMSKKYREYLFLSLKNIKDDLLAIGSGRSATLNINTAVFSKINLLYPNENILSEFHIRISSIFQKIKNNTFQIQTLSNTRDTLLPKLMSGKVRINI